MLPPLPPLQALRADSVRLCPVPATDGRRGLAGISEETQARWLDAAMRLDSAARARGAARNAALGAFLASEDIHTLPGSGIPFDLLDATARSLATAMEDWAFLQLAHTTLAALSVILPDAMLLARGRSLAHRARVARQLGEQEAAIRLYDEVAALGVAGDLGELRGRATVGRGVLARLAGNYPAARARFTETLAIADAAPESWSVAHQGLMVCAAAKEDYDEAAQHAWSAYAGAASDAQEIDMLIDLAQVLLDAGHPEAALRGFAAALARRPHARAALPAFGGVALAAVSARDASTARTAVRFAATRTRALVSSLGGVLSPMLPFQCASAMIELSEAFAVLEEDGASALAARDAEHIARMHGFHHLLHRLEHPKQRAAQVPATPLRRSIVESVEALEGAELVGAAN